MRVDTLALQLRQRSMLEAADLGVRFVQANAGSVYRCLLPTAVVVFTLALSMVEFASWLPMLLLFWLKPWLDRTVLFVLARAAFGQPTRFADLWRERADVWGGRFVVTVLLRGGLSQLWRAYVAPVFQLEGVRGGRRSTRYAQIARGRRGTAYMVLVAFFHAEQAFALSIASLAIWLSPVEMSGSIFAWFFSEQSALHTLILASAAAVSVLIVEPFYVGAGFAMYLNRRVELEAWDLEQELRLAFAS